MSQTEVAVFKYLAELIINNIGDIEYSSCSLYIERVPGMVGCKGQYINKNGVQSHFDVINKRTGLGNVIHSLYTITQTQPPIHADWNKAIFTLYPDGKVNMEYIWDAEYQAECDAVEEKARKEIERRRKISESLRKKKTE